MILQITVSKLADLEQGEIEWEQIYSHNVIFSFCSQMWMTYDWFRGLRTERHNFLFVLSVEDGEM